MEQTKPTLSDQLRAAIISILVGACISIITVLFQYAVEWLNDLPAEIPGAIVGMSKYLAWVRHKWTV